jgi:transcriptional regulator with XRE-family HTH domain
MTPMELMVLRKQYGLTQAEFGERLDPPVTRLTVSNWERSRFAIPHDIVARMIKLAPETPPAKTTKQDHTALQVYRDLRNNVAPWTHEEIIKMWHERGFTPSRAAQMMILEAFPELKALSTPNTNLEN